MKERVAARFEVMKQQLAVHNGAIDSEGPDLWKRLSPNGGKPKSAKEGE